MPPLFGPPRPPGMTNASGTESSDQQTVTNNQGGMDIDEKASSLEEDLNRYPFKTNEEVEHARWLWGASLVEIRPSDKNDFTRTFIPRNLLCKYSGWMSDRLPSVRSWPVIGWEEIEKDSSTSVHYTDIQNFARFLHHGEVEFSINVDMMMDKMEFTTAWCLGATLVCPEYQNEIMTQIRLNDNIFASRLVGCDCERGCGTPKGIADILALEPNTTLISTGISALDEEGKNKLFLYFVDKIIWDSIQGGERWLGAVHHGTCLAVMVAKAQVKAAKRKTPTYPPWSPFNNKKYKVTEERKQESASTIVSSAGGDESRKRNGGNCC